MAVTLLCVVVAVCVVAVVNTLDRTLDGVNAALATVNKPKSGTLSMIDDTILQGRLTIDATNKVLIHEQAQLSTLDGDIASLSSHTDATLTALSGTATAASRSLQDASDHLTPVLDSANATTVKLGSAIDALKPVETDLDKAVRDFDAQVTSPDVDRALKGLADTSQQAALTTTQFTGIATDLHKATSDATKPQPWWRKALGYGNMGVNIACLATHSCPF